MRRPLIIAFALAIGLLTTCNAPAQDVVAKKIVVGAITSVNNAAGTFTLDNKGTPLELTIHRNTDGASEIVKGRRVTVMYGQSLDGAEMLALRVKPSKGGAKPASDEPNDEPATSVGKGFGDKKVRATGSGLDGDKALLAAFTRAVEQQVGVLVDSDTIVENDEVIRDVVRTFSKGKVDSFKVIKEWQEDGLYHATIEATVELDKLADGLKARKVPVNQIDGKRLGLQGDYDREQKDKASDIASNDFPTYKLTDYLKAELVDKPKIEGAQTGVATMTVTVSMSADMKKWAKMADQISKTLRRTLPRNGVVVPTHQRNTPPWHTGYLLDEGIPGQVSLAAAQRLRQRGEAWGYLIMVAKGIAVSGPRARMFTWEGFEVPKPAFDTITRQFTGNSYYVKVTLRDENGQAVHEQEKPCKFKPYGAKDMNPFSCLYLGPYFFIDGPVDPLGHPVTFELAVAADDLKRVKEITAEVLEHSATDN